MAAPARLNPSADGTHSVHEVARLLDITPRWLSQLARDGIVPLPERGRYDTVACVRGYIRHLRGEAGERVEARQRREAAMADRAELDVVRAKGEIVEYGKRWLALKVAEVRQSFERWPERVAALLAAELQADPERTYIALERQVRELLAELAKGRGAVDGRDQP